MKKFIIIVLVIILAAGFVVYQKQNVDVNNNLEEVISSGENVQTLEIKKDMVTITFDVNGGDVIEPISIKKGEAFTFPKPSRAGYKFNGWSNVQGTVAFLDGWEISEDILAFANWEKVEQEIIATIKSGDQDIYVFAKIDVPTKIKNDSKWNPNNLINTVEYDDKKLLDEKALSYEGVISSNNEEHILKVYFLGYHFTEYSTAIFEIEVDGKMKQEVECDKLLLVDTEKGDGYTEVVAEDQWELGCENVVYAITGETIEQVGYFSTEKIL